MAGADESKTGWPKTAASGWAARDFQKGGDAVRGMLAVGIHGEDVGEAGLEGLLEGMEDRCAFAGILWKKDEAELRVGRVFKVLDGFRGAIGGAVDDDPERKAGFQGANDGLPEDRTGVVGGNENEGTRFSHLDGRFRARRAAGQASGRRLLRSDFDLAAEWVWLAEFVFEDGCETFGEGL